MLSDSVSLHEYARILKKINTFFSLCEYIVASGILTSISNQGLNVI